MKLKLPQTLFVAMLAALAAAPVQAVDTYTWSPAKDNASWLGTSSWIKEGKTSTSTWVDGSNVILNGSNSSASPKRAKLNGVKNLSEINANIVTLTDGYFRLTGDATSSVKFNTLTVSSGSTLEIGGSLLNRPFTVGDLELKGNMTIKSAMQITKISALSGNLTILYDTDTGDDNVVTIGAISSLDNAITTQAGLTFSKGATIAVTNEITVSGGETYYVDVEGKEGSNGFKGTKDAKMTVVTRDGANAKLTANSAQVTRSNGDVYTLGNDGVATKAGSTDYTTYYLTSGDGSVDAMTTASGNKLTTVDMTSSGTLTVDAALDTLYAHTQGGTVDMTDGFGITNMTVNADTTILTAQNQAVETTTMEVENGKEVSIQGKGGIKTGGVVIAGRDSATPATITNTGETANYNLGNQAMVIKDATVDVTDAEGDLLVISNTLENTKLINHSGVDVRAVGGAKLTDIAAYNGAVNVTNLSALSTLSLDTLTIGAGEQVGVYSGNDMTEDAVAALKVTGALTVGGTDSTLFANLTLGSGSMLDVSAGSALTLGCTLALEDNLVFVLNETQLNDLTNGSAVLLMDGIDALNGTLPTSFIVQDGAGQAFAGPVTLNFQGTQLSLLPEPTTATLSLLALVGLAARRRRH